MINKNLTLVEVVVNGVAGGNTQQRINFNDQPLLRGAKIWSIETYNIHDIPLSPQNNAVIAASVMQSAYLTVYIDDASQPPVYGKGEFMQQVPLVNMHTVQNTSNDPFERQPFQLQGQVISWDKVYLNLGAAIGNTVNNSFLFLVGYTFVAGNNTN